MAFFSRQNYFLIIDWLLMIALVAAGCFIPEWRGGPFVGAGVYFVFRYLFAGVSGWHIHNHPAYWAWDIFLVLSLCIAGLNFMDWQGGAFVGAVLIVVFRLIYHKVIDCYS